MESPLSKPFEYEEPIKIKIMNGTNHTRNKMKKRPGRGKILKKSTGNIKVNVVYGEKRFVDCMKNVIRKRTKGQRYQ